ncbi:hypothetical protein A6R68_09663, partial [Neotoma lepida]
MMNLSHHSVGHATAASVPIVNKEKQHQSPVAQTGPESGWWVIVAGKKIMEVSCDTDSPPFPPVKSVPTHRSMFRAVAKYADVSSSEKKQSCPTQEAKGVVQVTITIGEVRKEQGEKEKPMKELHIQALPQCLCCGEWRQADQGSQNLDTLPCLLASGEVKKKNAVLCTVNGAKAEEILEKEHFDLGITNGPSIGIYALNFYVVLGVRGFSIADKKRRTGCIWTKSRISKVDATCWLQQKFDRIVLPGKNAELATKICFYFLILDTMSLPTSCEYLSLGKVARFRSAYVHGSPYAINKPIDIKPQRR